jgi:hypothetical protein
VTVEQLQLDGELAAIRYRAAVQVREVLDGARRDAEKALEAAHDSYDGEAFETEILELVTGDQ